MIREEDSSAAQQKKLDPGNETAVPGSRLVRQIDRYLRLLNITREAILCVDDSCRIVAFNQGAERLLGYSRQEVLGMPVLDLLCEHFRCEEKHRVAALCRIAREEHLAFQTDRIMARHRNGSRIPCDVSLSQSPMLGHSLYTLVVRDSSKRLEREQRLAYRIEHDPLTDLPNRVLLNDRLNAGISRAARYGKRLAVVYLDLDNFKPINDRYGHELGDCLLQAVARRLIDTVRHSDTVSRLGGDEFIVCVEQIDRAEDGLAAAAKICDAFNQPFSILGREITTCASIGVALYPDHGRDVAELLRSADQAMYAAKAAASGPQLYQRLADADCEP
ncbi:MAG: sensor domain-containing diguanylate cyclase [Gammaproteobacteria bacterium]|jgi:diguanylate cyclase (GGDEF)-like protein/PAS domain S-box-containing protein